MWWAKKHQGAWISTSIVLCVFIICPLAGSKQTILSTPQRWTQIGKRKRKEHRARCRSLNKAQNRMSLKLGDYPQSWMIKSLFLWLFKQKTIVEHLIAKPWVLIATIKASARLASGFSPDLKPGCRDLIPFSHKSLSEVQHGCQMMRSGSQLQFLLIPKVLDGAEVRALCRPAECFQTKLGKLFLDGAALCTVALSCWNRKLLPETWKQTTSEVCKKI